MMVESRRIFLPSDIHDRGKGAHDRRSVWLSQPRQDTVPLDSSASTMQICWRTGLPQGWRNAC